MSSILERAKQIVGGVETISEWLGTGGEVVPQEVAQERANVCLGCHQNAPGSILKDAVAAAVKRHLEAKSEIGLRVDGEKKLMTCGACGCCLPLLIWVPQEKIQPHLTEEDLRKHPAHCWKLRKT